MPGATAVARFVGVEAYEAAAGAVMRDLFARDDESGVWFEDPVLLEKLAMAKLQAAADELATRWKWATAMVEVLWDDTARYPAVAPAWRRAWEHVVPMFAFPPAIRKLIYTTNALESLHRSLRKIIKTRGSFPSDEAASKLLLLAMSRMAIFPCPCVQHAVEVEKGRGRAKRNGAEEVWPGTGVRESVPNRPRQKRRP